MEEKVILEQLLAESKKRTRYTRLVAFAMVTILAVLLVTGIIVVPKAISVLGEIEALALSAEALVENAEASLGEISEMTVSLTDTSAGLDTFITDNAQTLSEAISEMKDIDVDTLNEAINDLHDAVAPFANLMNRFK